MEFTQDFASDLEAVIKAVENMEPVGFSRFGPGECFLVEYKKTHAGGSHWRHPGGSTIYTRRMRKAISANRKNYFLGMPCPCCNPIQWKWERNRVKTPLKRQSYATLFMNTNFKRAFDWFKQIYKGCLIAGPSDECDVHIPGNAAPSNWNYGPILKMIENADRPVLIAGGPVANLVIHEAKGLKVPIIDIGSLGDLLLMGKLTRPYQDETAAEMDVGGKDRYKRELADRLRTRTCKWKLAKRSIHAD